MTMGRIAAEIAARQIYWRSAPLIRAVEKRRAQQSTRSLVDRYRLQDRLAQVGVGDEAPVMVHTSIASISLHNRDKTVTNPLVVGRQILQDLTALVGEDGTLCMPSHPQYDGEPGFFYDKSDLVLRYDPAKTPSRVGLLSNLFLRRPEVKRSLHPLSSLACAGPLADTLLAENLNNSAPLPHGRGSAYHRFCELGGLVVSIGVPLVKSMTVLHVAEELRQEHAPIRGFAYERRFDVRVDDGWSEWLVQERRPEYVRSYALAQLRHDLLSQGILHESSFDGVRIDWAKAADVLSYMTQRSQASTYPYYLPALARVGVALPKAQAVSA